MNNIFVTNEIKVALSFDGLAYNDQMKSWFKTLETTTVSNTADGTVEEWSVVGEKFKRRWKTGGLTADHSFQTKLVVDKTQGSLYEELRKVFLGESMGNNVMVRLEFPHSVDQTGTKQGETIFVNGVLKITSFGPGDADAVAVCNFDLLSSGKPNYVEEVPTIAALKTTIVARLGAIKDQLAKGVGVKFVDVAGDKQWSLPIYQWNNEVVAPINQIIETMHTEFQTIGAKFRFAKPIASVVGLAIVGDTRVINTITVTNARAIVHPEVKNVTYGFQPWVEFSDNTDGMFGYNKFNDLAKAELLNNNIVIDPIDATDFIASIDKAIVAVKALAD